MSNSDTMSRSDELYRASRDAYQEAIDDIEKKMVVSYHNYIKRMLSGHVVKCTHVASQGIETILDHKWSLLSGDFVKTLDMTFDDEGLIIKVHLEFLETHKKREVEDTAYYTKITVGDKSLEFDDAWFHPMEEESVGFQTLLKQIESTFTDVYPQVQFCIDKIAMKVSILRVIQEI